MYKQQLCKKIIWSNPRVRVRILTFWPVHGKVLPCIICLPTAVLISQAVFLLERGQTDRWDWTPYPMPVAIQPAWVINVWSQKQVTQYTRFTTADSNSRTILAHFPHDETMPYYACRIHSRKHTITVWCRSVSSAYAVWLTRGQHATPAFISGKQ